MQLRMTSIALSLVYSLVIAMLFCSAAPADLTPSREAIEGIIHDYLMQHPDVLMEVLRDARYKVKREENDKRIKALTDRRREILNSPATPVGGNPQGDVSIVEFFDYRCPYCKQVLQSLQTLMSEDHKLRLVYKEMPVLGPESVVAAHAALAAHRQGKYEAFHGAMMATRTQITEEIVYKVAGSVGLDVERLNQDRTSPDIDQALKANLALADALNIHGTPTFIIGNHIVQGAINLNALKDIIAEARKE
jgi:protein-disulfide isomerase